MTAAICAVPIIDRFLLSSTMYIDDVYEEVTMAQMIRKQIYIDADNEWFLKRWASEPGVTEAEVVRQALDDAEERALSDTRKEALPDILTYIREHRMRDVPQANWTFNREELYEERMDQIMKRSEARGELTGK